MFDSCDHCDWIWKSDACDIFYRELGEIEPRVCEPRSRDATQHDPTAVVGAAAAAAESQTESITYELASRPDPGLFGRFLGAKGYQRGRAVDGDRTAAAAHGTASPTRATWSSEADWRAQISNFATHDKRTRKSAKLLLAQQALNRLRHWTSGHHNHHAMTADGGGSPLRQDLMDDAKSAEEAKTLLRRPRPEDCSEVRTRIATT
ncbi:hypothetical protein HPB50_003008 [Hyalomma asiaticum]|uniref:Uncharacterized protein n=1 Tax=Hyalomma asiaticum TaxID=266040 RepID=A0ACB7T3C2_HYAAI|nr:hypothetical protein HPB50_003008 [Hyalomma asiaticum]